MSDATEPTISIVLTTLGAPSRLRRSLPAAVRALEARGVDGDEILVVDDSAAERAGGVVAELLGSEASDAEDGDGRRTTRLVRVLETEANLGASAAALLGARRASGDLALLMHDDVALRVGAIEHLAAAFERDSVFAAGPSLVIEGDPEDGRTHREVRLVDDRLEVQPVEPARSAPAPAPGQVDPARATGDAAADGAPRPVTYLPAACLMVRRERFVSEGGYDPLLAPFTWEDVDLGLSARRRGERVVRVPAAVAELARDLPSVLDGLPKGLAEAVGERNRLLTRWKHLSTRAEASEHLVGLWRSVMEAGLAGDRDRLEAICLAFEELPAVTASRQAMSGAVRTLDDVV